MLLLLVVINQDSGQRLHTFNVSISQVLSHQDVHIDKKQ